MLHFLRSPQLASRVLAACCAAFLQPLIGQAGSVTDTQSVVQVTSWYDTDARDEGQLHVAVEVQDGYHVYAISQPKPFIATAIQLAPSQPARLVGEFTASREPGIRVHETLGVELHEHVGRVEWTAPLAWTSGPVREDAELRGEIQLQACAADRCLAPSTIEFVARRRPKDSRPAAVTAKVATPPRSTAASPTDSGDTSVAPSHERDVSRRPQTFTPVGTGYPAARASEIPLLVAFPIAFLGGLLLNLMPCVLPVVGLKVMSFMGQAGQSRGKAFALSLSHSLGLLSVMMVLASLAVFAGLGWGEQFSSATFNVVLSAVVFVFALSLLGVWEIPVPGLVGTAAGGSLATREGYTGAFAKGALATVLATPCSGPLLGTALTWAVSQPPWLTYAVFATVGLGMASPLLLLGLFPKSAVLLPQPGPSMNTFKQTLGFILLATVIYLWSFITPPLVVPTLALLLGLGVGCWWIGRIALTEPRVVRLRGWAVSGAIAVAIGIVAFGWLSGVMDRRFARAVQREIARLDTTESVESIVSKGDEFRWRSFSRNLLDRLLEEGKTVLVDFTADWCLTCQANEAVAVDRPEVRQLIERLDIVALRADKTAPNPEADALLAELGNRAGSIPFYAVFPGERPNQPIVLDGVFASPSPILRVLREATVGVAPMPTASSKTSLTSSGPNDGAEGSASQHSTRPAGEKSISRPS